MNHFNYLKRLGRQGGRLMWRVLMILGPVVGYSIWQSMRSMFTAADQLHNSSKEEYGEFPDGTPWVENIEHEAWESVYGKDARRI